jgi:CRP-like cAMP-binding protein
MSIHAGAAPRPPAEAVSIPRANELLALMPDEDYRRVSPQLRHVPLRRKQSLLRQGQPVQEIIFPAAGVCSLVKTTADGHSIEIIGIGSEGAIGASVAWGQAESATDVVVQMPDEAAVSMPVHTFTAEFQRGGAFAAIMAHYCRVFALQLMQVSACNSLHSADERCCRWLLTMHDRFRPDSFSITHEELARALGVRRPTVTLIMANLHRTGLIEGRGKVKVLDRAGLAARACECYPSTSRGVSTPTDRPDLRNRT